MANKQRLIDANALEFEPDENCIANGVLIWGSRSGGKTMTTVLSALKKMIDNAPHRGCRGSGAWAVEYA